MHLKGMIISPSSFLVPPSSFPRHHINRPHERRCAVDPSRRTLNHFYPYDVIKVHGQIHRIVARLRVTDVDAVEQQDDLFRGTATDGDVRLGTDGSPLPHIHADGVFQ